MVLFISLFRYRMEDLRVITYSIVLQVMGGAGIRTEVFVRLIRLSKI